MCIISMSDTIRGHMRGVRSPESRITDVCESLGMLGMNSGPLQKQQMLLTASLSKSSMSLF